jgi:hypothetical protein
VIGPGGGFPYQERGGGIEKSSGSGVPEGGFLFSFEVDGWRGGDLFLFLFIFETRDWGRIL